MQFPEKPLGYVKDGLESIGHEISYVYEDLIFPNNTAYLIQFGKENHDLDIYISSECDIKESRQIKNDLTHSLNGKIGFALTFAGTFSIQQDQGEELKIQFKKQSSEI